MAKITVIGNIGKGGANLRKVNNSGREDFVADFQVAENYKKRNGETITQWHKVTIWRGFAEKLAPYLTEGRKVLVQGTVTAKIRPKKDGTSVAYLDIQAEDITLLDGKKPGGELPAEVMEEVSEEIVEEATPWD